jgi:cytosine/adenosine deaminase-related metal-dependent hydrolase
VIYQPVTDELYAAQRGRGADLNGRPISVSGMASIWQAIVEAGWHCDVRVSGTDIVAVGTNLVQPGDEVHDCSGTVVIPGLINVHTHAATGLFRGLADDKPKRFWSPHFQVPGHERFGIEDYSASLRAVCAESLLNGVTCIADRLGNVDLLAPVIEASGIRAVVGHTLRDNGTAADWATMDRILERYGTDPRRRVFAGIAPHALDSCSDELLQACARRAEDGARVLGLELVTGSIEVGKRAALVILDAERLCMSPDNDVVSNIIYANVTRAIRDVMVDGHWCVDGGRLTDASEADLAAAHSARAAKRQWPL